MTLVLAARRQIGYALGRAAGGLAWLLRDEFTTDLAAGSVNGTAAEPGPGTRVVVDTANKLWLESGKLRFNLRDPHIVGDPGLWLSEPIQRIAGRMAIFDIPTNSTNFWVGWDKNLFSSAYHSFYWYDALRIDSASGPVVQSTVIDAYVMAVTLRNNGAFYFRKQPAISNSWLLSWISSNGSTSPLYITVSGYYHAPVVSRIGVPNEVWLPTPLASDGFGSTFGTTDGLGHAEGIAGGIGTGGGGVAWSNVGSTWSVSGGKAINTAPSGLSQQISVLSAGTENVFAGAGLTRSAGSVGLVLSWDSASSPANGVLVYLDGTNCNIDKIVAGSTSNVRTTAVTYSAGARLVVAKNGTEYRVYYNNALVGAANTISDAGIINNTLHGIFSTDASNTLDDFTCYATGTGGQYATLDQYIQ